MTFDGSGHAHFRRTKNSVVEWQVMSIGVYGHVLVVVLIQV